MLLFILSSLYNRTILLAIILFEQTGWTSELSDGPITNTFISVYHQPAKQTVCTGNLLDGLKLYAYSSYIYNYVIRYFMLILLIYRQPYHSVVWIHEFMRMMIPALTYLFPSLSWDALQILLFILSSLYNLSIYRNSSLFSPLYIISPSSWPSFSSSKQDI